MLQHIVLFALEGFDSPEHKANHIAKIKEALERLPNLIPALHSMRVDLNENAAEAIDFALVAEVANLDTLPDYANHPEHQRVVLELIKPYLKTRACIDYTR